jgi:DNA-binding transcriptional MocR family regulator
MNLSGHTAVDIAASLEKALLAGGAGAGEALPTVRQLAVSLRVSPTTVAAAYKLLRARGLVAGQGRQGTRVASRRISPVTAVLPVVPVGTRDLATGDADGTLLPSLDQTLRAIQVERRGYGIGPDRADLVAFASSEFEADDIPAGAVAVVSGGLDAIERILREHLRAGDRVAIEDPSFPGIVDLVTVSGYRVVPFSIDDEGPKPGAVDAALARGCHAIIVTPRAQNPTGAALSQSRAAELREVLRRFPHVVLIENDCAGPLADASLQTIRHPSHERWAVVRSLSKFLGPDLRVAVVAGDDVTIARVRGRQALGARWVSHILQQLALTLWADPTHGRRIARAGEIYAQRRTAAIAALSAQGIAAHGRSGFNVWLPVRDERRVVRALAEKGWAVAAGERFRIQSGAGIRITVSTLSPEDAARFAADLADVLRSASAGFA